MAQLTMLQIQLVKSMQRRPLAMDPKRLSGLSSSRLELQVQLLLPKFELMIESQH